VAMEACTNRGCEDKCEGVGPSILNADTIHFFPRLALFPPGLFRKHTKAGLMVRIYAASRARRASVIASLHKRFCYKRYLFHVYTAAR